MGTCVAPGRFTQRGALLRLQQQRSAGLGKGLRLIGQKKGGAGPVQDAARSFGRADLRITAQVSSSSLTAKMRSVAAGVVNEQSLGGGSDVAKTN